LSAEHHTGVTSERLIFCFPPDTIVNHFSVPQLMYTHFVRLFARCNGTPGRFPLLLVIKSECVVPFSQGEKPTLFPYIRLGFSSRKCLFYPSVSPALPSPISPLRVAISTSFTSFEIVDPALLHCCLFLHPRKGRFPLSSSSFVPPFIISSPWTC